MLRKAWIAIAVTAGILLLAIAIRLGDWLSTRTDQESPPSKHVGSQGYALVSGGKSAPDPARIFSDEAMVRLGRAVLKGDADGIRKQAREVASVDGQGRDGLTPLHLSLLGLQFESFKALLDEGADANVPADNGDSPMSLAALMPEPRWLELALKRGGNADRPDRRGRTPLMIAARQGRTDNVRALITGGAHLDTADRHGETALFHTFQAFQPKLEIARMLIAAGADPERENAAGFKARDFAEVYGNPAYLAVFPSQ
jgi:hypothetical protein